MPLDGLACTLKERIRGAHENVGDSEAARQAFVRGI
jgi:hypothetical protein